MDRDPNLNAARLSDPTYYAQMQALYQRDPKRWGWYLRVHIHQCQTCRRVIEHTGLDATRDGDAVHVCCGRDVRGLQ